MEIILDEFIIDEVFGSPSTRKRALSILKDIKDICHVIIVTPGLLKRYYRKVKNYERSLGALSKEFKPLKVFAQFLSDSDKTDCRNEPSDEESLGEFSPDDRDVVAAALATESEKAVITADEDLVARLRERSMSETHGWTLLLPDDALRWLSHSAPEQ